jgi:hypothetical protein
MSKEKQQPEAVYRATMAAHCRTVQIEESKLGEFQELCHEMSNSNGLVMNHLLIALPLNGEKQRELLETALDLSIRGATALMKLMSKLGQLRESLAKGNSPGTEG